MNGLACTACGLSRLSSLEGDYSHVSRIPGNCRPRRERREGARL